MLYAKDGAPAAEAAAVAARAREGGKKTAKRAPKLTLAEVMSVDVSVWPPKYAIREKRDDATPTPTPTERFTVAGGDRVVSESIARMIAADEAMKALVRAEEERRRVEESRKEKKREAETRKKVKAEETRGRRIRRGGRRLRAADARGVGGATETHENPAAGVPDEDHRRVWRTKRAPRAPKRTTTREARRRRRRGKGGAAIQGVRGDGSAESRARGGGKVRER